MPFLKSVFQEENKSLVQEIIEWVRYIIGKYITGLLIEMAIVATVVNVVFMLLGAKYAILLGLITGLFNIIPYISIVSALAISSAVTFATAPSQPTVIYVMITLFITYLVDSNVLLPLVVASKVRINTQITVLGSIISELIWDPGAFFCLFRCSRYLNFSLTG
jgi:predicted PurR-regulated permease PerM